MRKFNTEFFITKAREIHGDRYDYSESKYISRRNKIIIICKVHGKFYRYPMQHIKLKYGCNICNKKRLTKEKFIENAILVHGSKYDYTFVKFINALTKVSINCYKHGLFEQLPSNHTCKTKPQGCPKCSLIEKISKLKYTNEEIDNLLLMNNKLILRNDDYNKTFPLVEFKCSSCSHIWKRRPNPVTSGKSGCLRCKDTKLSNELIDIRILERELPIRRVDEYINSYSKTTWSCLKCDKKWLAKPNEVLRKGNNRDGSGCPNCKAGKNESIIGEILTELNIEYKHNYRIDTSERKFFPDYFLPLNNIFIEYNGIQHYKPTCFGDMTKEDALETFLKQKERDDLFRKYCSKENIQLIEIDGRQYKGKKLKDFIRNMFKEIK